MDVHDLTAAYALHALDDDDRTAFEAHLVHCERCRAELAMLTESAAALAWAVEAPAPPQRLRERIVAAAAAGSAEVVVPLRARRPWQVAAAAAACAAVGVGVWAATLQNRLSHRETLGIVAARTVPLHGHAGMVALSAHGEGVLVVEHLPRAPAGMTYEAWVIPAGGSPHRAGLFDGGGAMTMVKLAMPVRSGAVVAATLEHDGGADAPTTKPMFSATA